MYLASERLPIDLDTGPASISFRGGTVSGREIAGDVRIVDRHDDAYGTVLILVGLRPLATDP